MIQHRQLSQNEVENPTMRKLRSWAVSATPESCPLSISTRAIGFMLSEVTNYLDACSLEDSDDEDNRVKAPLSEMYRVSLAQLEARVHLAKSENNQQYLFTPSNHGPESVFDLNPSPSLSAMIKTVGCNQFNVVPLSTIINSIGHVQMNGAHYKPVFTTKVTPLNLRISNLREYCEKIANPDTPAEDRKIGYLLNPIPNAEWENENDLESVRLKNPDEIIAADYDRQLFIKDWKTMCRYLEKMEAEKKVNGSKIDYQGPGNPGILASTHVVPERRWRLNKSNQVHSCDEQIFWSREHLSPDSWSLGVLTLAGEVLSAIDAPYRSRMLATAEYIGRWGVVSNVFLRNYS